MKNEIKIVANFSGLRVPLGEPQIFIYEGYTLKKQENKALKGYRWRIPSEVPEKYEAQYIEAIKDKIRSLEIIDTPVYGGMESGIQQYFLRNILCKGTSPKDDLDYGEFLLGQEIYIIKNIPTFMATKELGPITFVQAEVKRELFVNIILYDIHFLLGKGVKSGVPDIKLVEEYDAEQIYFVKGDKLIERVIDYYEVLQKQLEKENNKIDLFQKIVVSRIIPIAEYSTTS